MSFSEHLQAGGRMIGKKMAAMFLDNHELDFYKVRDQTR